MNQYNGLTAYLILPTHNAEGADEKQGPDEQAEQMG